MSERDRNEFEREIAAQTAEYERRRRREDRIWLAAIILIVIGSALAGIQR